MMLWFYLGALIIGHTLCSMLILLRNQNCKVIEKYHDTLFCYQNSNPLPRQQPTTTKQNFKPLPVLGIKTRETCHRSQTDFLCGSNTG